MFDVNTPEGAAAIQRLGLGMMAAGGQGKGIGSAFGIAGLGAQDYYDQLIKQKIDREQQKHSAEMADKRLAIDQQQADATYKHQDAMLTNAERATNLAQQKLDNEKARIEQALGAVQGYQQRFMDMKPVQEGMAGPPQLMADRRTPGMVAGYTGLAAGLGTPEQQARMLQQGLGMGIGLDTAPSVPSAVQNYKFREGLPSDEEKRNFDLLIRNDNVVKDVNGAPSIINRRSPGEYTPLTTPFDEARGQGIVAGGVKAAQLGAEDQTNAAISLPKAKTNLDEGLRMIDEIAAHPALDYYAGMASKVPGVKQALETTPEVQDLLSRQEQIGSQAWLSGFIDNMKGAGAGAFTNVEGEQMRAAQARVNLAVGKENYLKALNDYKRVLQSTYANAVKRASGDRTVGPSRAPDSSPLLKNTESPNIPSNMQIAKPAKQKPAEDHSDEELDGWLKSKGLK